MVALYVPMLRLYDLEFLLGKWLSVKVLINKDNFGFEGGFLVRVEFDFWAVKWVKGLIYKDLDDMGYDKGFDE